MEKSFKISITGLVQGVGFRPYIYGLAQSLSLNGTVSNCDKGVIIMVNGDESTVKSFYQTITANPPPVSKIEACAITEVPAVALEGFKIIPSETTGSPNLRLTPDFAICEDCVKELNNPDNRRYHYPFTTCVNCGPRWAITQNFPFDRENTSIGAFPMCDDCFKEYEKPSDRRFHSQTNSCIHCGFHLTLRDSCNNLIEVPNKDILSETAKLIKEGNIVAIKNTSGYLLCCHAENKDAIIKLRRLKKRPKKPFAVMYPSLQKLKDEIPLSLKQIEAFESAERPIVIVSTENHHSRIDFESIAPGLNQLGVMVPYTGILHLLGQYLNFPIVATSGNIHGSPILSNEKEAFQKLKGVADYFVHHELPIEHPQDDSVLKFSFVNDIPVLFRRSRGYAPNVFIKLPKATQKILAMGSDLKSTIALLPNKQLYVSQYLGNLENFDVYERFTSETDALLRIFQCQPEVLLVDEHPRYFSSSFGKELAQRFNIPSIAIQHHKAHFASVLGEHQLFGDGDKILGVVWDGVGFGDDHQVWGGEFFEYQNGSMERIGHFDYFDWLAGDKMSKEPRLAAFSLIEDDVASKFSSEEFAIYSSLKQKKTLKTSSVGRLFDAVASILNLCDFNTFEGEASMLLENQIGPYELSKCTNYCNLSLDGSIPTFELLTNVLKDVRQNTSVQQIAANFIYTLASIIIAFAGKHGYQSICCSGGVFQNTTLVDMLVAMKPEAFKLYFNKELSPNDENISFGQIMYYLNCMQP